MDGGSFQQADEESFPILKGQEASIVVAHVAARRYSRTALASQRVGDQHRHQRRRQLGLSSTATATTKASTRRSATWCSRPRVRSTTSKTAAPGDMKIVIVQNTSAPEAKDNIGIGESISRLPPRVLSAIFGVPEKTFNSFKKIDEAIVVLRKH